jgi:hypothetical protein
MTCDDGCDYQDKSTDYGFEVLLPFSDRLCVICSSNYKGNYLALSLNDELKHAEQKHSNRTITFKCHMCSKVYKSKHAALCHIAKCKGQPTEVVGALSCSACGKSFASNRGLSQHERHEHPSLRNTAREAASTRNISHKSPKGYRKVWSKEEIDLMCELELRFRGDRLIANKMTEFFPNKTNKQIRDKRAEKTYKNRIAAILEERATEPSNSDSGETDRQILLDAINRTDNGINDGLVSIEDAGENPNEDPNTLEGPPETEIPRNDNEMRALNVPKIIITDHSHHASEAETVWRGEFLQGTLELEMDKSRTSDQAKEVLKMLESAIQYAKEENGQVPDQHIDYIYGTLVSYILHSNKTAEDMAPKKYKRKKGTSRGARRRYIYSRTQDLYKNNPSRLAKCLRENAAWYMEGDIPLSEEQINSTFQKLWGKKIEVREPFPAESGEEALELNNILPSITREDISARISKLKKNTAAGPDGIRKDYIMKYETQEMLRLLFSFLTACGQQPSAWRMNRTTLILKEGKDPSKVENYRPITIASLICRLYWGVIDQKIRMHIKMNPRQKGFVSEAGCFNDIHIFNEIIKLAKKEKGLIATQLDISKAFDTVPHDVIDDALHRKGVPLFICRLIRNSYKGIESTITHGAAKVPIKIKRGVKQGDPLSPLIFNLILEPLITELQNLQGFPINDTTSVSILAFADDIILLAPNESAARKLVDTTHKYLDNLGMKIEVNKSAAFKIKQQRTPGLLPSLI